MILIAFKNCEDNAISRHNTGLYLRNALLKSVFGKDMENKIYFSEKNRPEFDFKSADISVSHSKHISAAALSFDFKPDSMPDIKNLIKLDVTCDRIGLDIEAVLGNDKSLKKISEKYFFKEEKDFLLSLPDKDFLNEFIRIWTVKESVCKASGKGISELKRINSFKKEISENVTSYPLYFNDEKYYLSIFRSKK